MSDDDLHLIVSNYYLSDEKANRSVKEADDMASKLLTSRDKQVQVVPPVDEELRQRQLKYDISVRIVAEEARKLGISPPEYGQVYDSEAHERLLNDLIGFIKVRDASRDQQIALEAKKILIEGFVKHISRQSDDDDGITWIHNEVEPYLVTLKQSQKEE